MKLSLFSVSYAGFWGQDVLDLPSFIARASKLGYDAVMLKIGILAAIPDGPETSVNDMEPSKWVFGGRRVFEEFAEAFEGLRELLEARRYQDLKLNGACSGTTLAGSPGWSAE